LPPKQIKPQSNYTWVKKATIIHAIELMRQTRGGNMRDSTKMYDHDNAIFLCQI